MGALLISFRYPSLAERGPGSLVSAHQNSRRLPPQVGGRVLRLCTYLRCVPHGKPRSRELAENCWNQRTRSTAQSLLASRGPGTTQSKEHSQHSTIIRPSDLNSTRNRAQFETHSSYSQTQVSGFRFQKEVSDRPAFFLTDWRITLQSDEKLCRGLEGCRT